ncbi:MAG: CDP-archaeol synthase [Candidatus Poseidoniales archaeon]|nr:MAG: CDP-archaeol synthase [Candidatus Poseidoniales archaeon]
MNITPLGSIFTRIIHIRNSAKVHPPNFTATFVSSDALPWDDPLIAPLLVLWLYLPGYLSNTAAMLGGKWIPDLTGIPVFTIDGGRVMSDGNRVLGDGKTWNGLIGGTIGGGLLGVLTQTIANDNTADNAPFLDSLSTYGTSSSEISDAWFYIGGESTTAFTIGCVLGFGCMVGDSAGSFVKRRLGHKREGSVSSKAPLLDTLPFAASAFVFGQLLLGPSIVGSSELLMGMVILLFVTPILHRSFNIIGFRLGLKSVPY